MVHGRWAVHGYGVRTTPQHSTLERSRLASGINAGFDAALVHYINITRFNYSYAVAGQY